MWRKSPHRASEIRQNRSVNSPLLSRTISLLTVAGLTLAACGGSDDSSPDSEPAEQVADTAAASDSGEQPDTAEPTESDPTDAGEDTADESVGEPLRPTRDELCAVVDRASDELAALAGFAEIEERTGSVLGGDCAVTSTSVGYVSLSLLPAITQGAQGAADSRDGVQSTSPALIDGILIEDPTGLTQSAVFELDGSVYLVQMESDGASTAVGLVEEAAIQLRFRLDTR